MSESLLGLSRDRYMFRNDPNLKNLRDSTNSVIQRAVEDHEKSKRANDFQ